MNANESQVKKSGQGETREEGGYFQMRFEMRSRADEVETDRMVVPNDRRRQRCPCVFVFRKRESLKGEEHQIFKVQHAAQNTVLKSENAVRTQISFEMDLLNMIFKRSNFTWYSSCLKKVMSTS